MIKEKNKNEEIWNWRILIEFVSLVYFCLLCLSLSDTRNDSYVKRPTSYRKYTIDVNIIDKQWKMRKYNTISKEENLVETCGLVVLITEINY